MNSSKSRTLMTSRGNERAVSPASAQGPRIHGRSQQHSRLSVSLTYGWPASVLLVKVAVSDPEQYLYHTDMTVKGSSGQLISEVFAAE
jgi:hypothetical protein